MCGVDFLSKGLGAVVFDTKLYSILEPSTRNFKKNHILAWVIELSAIKKQRYEKKKKLNKTFLSHVLTLETVFKVVDKPLYKYDVLEMLVSVSIGKLKASAYVELDASATLR